MPHNLRSTELGFLQRSKHVETAVSTASKVAKNRLCVAMRRASFQTRSTGASCGLYGGRNSRVSTARYVRRHGLSNTAWWYRAVSTTSTMRVSWARCRSRVFRTVSNVAALNVAHREWMNVPVRKLTAPTQATDLRVGAWSRIGSLISGGTHRRHRVPCCWKWHSSTLQSATPRRRARRCSVFTRRDLDRVGLSDLGSGLAQSEPHVTEDALALAHTQPHLVAQAQMSREQLALPQMTGMTKRLWVASQVTPQRHPWLGVQRSGSPRTSPVAHAGQSMGFKTRHPALHRPSIFPQHVGDLLAAVAAGDQQQPVQPMVVPRLIGPSDFLLDGQAHDVGISKDQVSHDRPSASWTGHQYHSIMRQYI
jgi:hypothetical protein